MSSFIKSGDVYVPNRHGCEGGNAAASVDNTFDFVRDWRAESGNSAGNSLVVAVSFNSGATSIKKAFVKNEGNNTGTPVTCTSVTGNVSGAWTALTSRSHSNNDMSGRWFYLIGGAGTDTTLTAAFSTTAANFKIIQVTEEDMFTTAVFDKESVNSGTDTAPTGTAIVTTGIGCVTAGYAAYNNNAVTGLLFGNNSGWNSPEVNTTFTQVWGTQTTAAGSVTPSLTVNSSSAWIVCTLSFKGTGKRTSTASNYAHGYMDFSGTGTGTALDTTNLALAQAGQGNVAGQFGIVLTIASNLAVAASEFTKNKPLVIQGTAISTVTANKGFNITHTALQAPNYWTKTINRHRRIRVTGFFHLGPTNGGNTSLFDMVSIKGTNMLSVLQLNCSNADPNDYNPNCETIVSGGTNHSANFLATSQGSYSFCFWLNTQTTLCALKIWDSSNALVLDVTPLLDPTHEDITVLRFGNAEVGTESTRVTVFQHLAWNFDTDDLSQP